MIFPAINLHLFVIKGSSSWAQPGAPGLLQGGLPSGEAWRKGGI